MTCEDETPDVYFGNNQAFHDGIDRLAKSTKTAWAVKTLKACVDKKRNLKGEAWYQSLANEARWDVDQAVEQIRYGHDGAFTRARRSELGREIEKILQGVTRSARKENMASGSMFLAHTAGEEKDVDKRLAEYAEGLSSPAEKQYVGTRMYAAIKPSFPKIEPAAMDAKIVEYVNTALPGGNPQNRFARRYALSSMSVDEKVGAKDGEEGGTLAKSLGDMSRAAVSLVTGDVAGKLTGDALVSGFRELIVSEVTPQQLGLGVLLLSCVYMHGWSIGRDEASDLCAQGPESCGAVSIVWTMVLATAKVWLLTSLLLLILLTIEIVVVGVLRRPLAETAEDIVSGMLSDKKKSGGEHKMLSVRIMFSWLMDPRMLMAIGASFACAAAFAAVYSTWLDIRGKESTPDDYRMCAQNTYAFQLIAFVVFVVSQFWLKSWW